MTETPKQTSESTTPRPKRRWMQFNLRTLLVLTLVVGFGLGWIVNERRKNGRLQADIDALKSMECEVHCESKEHSFQPTRFDWLLARKKTEIVDWVGFPPYRNPNKDAGLERLKGLPNLTGLSLGYTAITDAGLLHLKSLTKLNELSLDGT
jgi:hypothetical protein